MVGAGSIAVAAPAFSAPPPPKIHDFSSNNNHGEAIPLSVMDTLAKAGEPYVSLKANEGGAGNYVWWQFGELADRAHKDGMADIPYDFVHPGWVRVYGDGQDLKRERNADILEASQFLNVTAPHWRKGDIAAIDIEVNDGRSPALVSAFVGGWLDQVKAAGRPTIAYSYWSFYATNNLPSVVGKDGFWLAAYQPFQPDFHGQTPFAWQHTDCSYVRGVAGCVDESYLLASSSKAAPTPAPGKSPVVTPVPVKKADINPWQPHRLIQVRGVAAVLELRLKGRALVAARVPSPAVLAILRRRGETLQVLLPTKANKAKVGALPKVAW